MLFHQLILIMNFSVKSSSSSTMRILIFSLFFFLKSLITIGQIDTLFYSGAMQTYTVPAGITTINIEAYGAEGRYASINGDAGGKGGYSTGDLTVAPGQIIYIYVGGEGTTTPTANAGQCYGGFNGGGNGGNGFSGGSGGGASDVRVLGTSLSNRVIVAGGGGGADNGGIGGSGGGLIGVDGGFNSGSAPATGGTQSSGGSGALKGGYTTMNGILGIGGDNIIYSGSTFEYGGGGGGGYYGGGGGHPWAGGGGGSSYIGGVTNSSTIAGVNNGNGLVIISYQLPTLVTNFSASDSNICTGTTVNFTDLSSGTPNSWVWDFGDGNTSILQNPAHIYANSGIYNVSLTASNNLHLDTETKNSFITVTGISYRTDIISSCGSYTWIDGNTYTQSTNAPTYTFQTAAGCELYYSLNLTINELPNVDAGQDISFCEGSYISLSVSGASSYLWSNGIGNSQNTTLVLSTTNFSVIGTDSNGCTNSDTVLATLIPVPNVMAASIIQGQGTSLNPIICLGDSIKLIGNGAGTYNWDNGVINDQWFSPIATNTYNVVGTDILTNCSNDAQILVTVNDLPNVVAASISLNQVTSLTPNICLGDSIRLVGNGADIYNWDNGVINDQWFSPIETNTYNVLGIDNSTNCSKNAQVLVTVNELPQILKTIIDERYGSDASINIDIVAGDSPFDFDWDIDGLGDIDDEQNLSGIQAGNYTLVIRDNNGCENRFTIIVEFISSVSLVIPSAITPNSDGKNDVWDIIGLNRFPEMQLQIFDRNGHIVHQQTGIYENWDGYFQRKVLPDGDYFYILDLKNGEQPKKGAVSIKF